MVYFSGGAECGQVLLALLLVLCEMNQFEFSCNDGEPTLIIGSIEVVTVDYLRKIQDGDCTFLNIVAIRRN